MNYYYGNTTDPLFAVYEVDGICYPVFEEKYGKEALSLSPEMEKNKGLSPSRHLWARTTHSIGSSLRSGVFNLRIPSLGVPRGNKG